MKNVNWCSLYSLLCQVTFLNIYVFYFCILYLPAPSPSFHNIYPVTILNIYILPITPTIREASIEKYPNLQSALMHQRCWWWICCACLLNHSCKRPLNTARLSSHFFYVRPSPFVVHHHCNLWLKDYRALNIQRSHC